MADKLRVYSTTLFSTLTRLEGVWRGFAVLLMLAFAASAGWAQGLQTPRDCPLSNGTTVKAYLCLDDIIVVDGSGSDGVPAPGFPYGKSVGGLYLVNPSTGDQTVITSGGKLSQASSVAMEPATGKLLAVSRTYGIIRVDPKDGSQQVLLKGGTGWGTGFPTLSDQTIASDRARNAEMFIYPAAIVIDAVSNILVTDTGINLFDRKLKSDPADPSVPNCTDPKDVRTCESFPGKIIRLRKKLGEGPGIYEVPEVVATGGDVANSKLLSDPFDIAVTNAGNIYVTDMNATLGNTDPTKGPT